MRKSVICGYLRSPFTPSFKGSFSKIRPDDILKVILKEIANTKNLNIDDIEDVKVGCAFPEGEQGLNIARMTLLMAGYPIHIAGVTTNRFCGSSMQTIHDAAGAIACGAGDLFISAGVESMTRVPMAGFNPLPNPDLYEKYADAYASMGDTAENIAKKYKISRNEQEEFAIRSHELASKAALSSCFEKEIVAIGDVKNDECIREKTTMESLSSLSPAFDKNGTITAGTSSPLTDGAAVVIVASEEYADANGLEKIAYIKSFAVSGCKPELMGLGPIESTRKTLKRADLSIDDIDIIELNEAFSSQSIACIRDLKLDINKINIDGGAIALGHPLGATGARIVGKAASLLKREDKKYALATQCIGGGQGIATILEAI